MSLCEKCDGFFFRKICGCKKFKIRTWNGEESFIWAENDSSAASIFAQKSNEANRNYLIGESLEIEVDGTKFMISAEQEITYAIRKL